MYLLKFKRILKLNIEIRDDIIYYEIIIISKINKETINKRRVFLR